MECITWFAPILPGKMDEWRALVEEIKGPRWEEQVGSWQRMGVTREVASLMQTPEGDFVCLFHEAEDLAKAYQSLATSEDPFDVWFRGQLASVHGVTAEMLQGPLPAKVFFDYRDAG
ncbi:hypothetical protein QFZ79_000021 [Arthrobacter sp. V4I6]|uniref:DUF6176 family protein n=1 Tax=unclassified Arthrobacter TaxID=235627 RepID=UPI00277E242E|nr:MULTISPECIES: DUF6176 family protein [unclassified Arthrobacter]MDQ0822274.1 hypothetical protein [Arthrobacter sp. V1I7]MDQ0851910.1 hypothetical protein [Arthrobacter sp. V4I6]